MSVLKADNINNCQKMSINVKKLPEKYQDTIQECNELFVLKS